MGRHPLNLICDETRRCHAQLEALGSEQTRKNLRRHGATDPFFGVKVGDLKPVAQKLKGQQDLALQLYATGNSDAQYLAGMIPP